MADEVESEIVIQLQVGASYSMGRDLMAWNAFLCILDTNGTALHCCTYY
jgi:hypothetical protein